MILQQIILISFFSIVAFASDRKTREIDGILSVFRRLPWERKSFEDDSYDATKEESDYSDWEEGKWAKEKRLKLCSTEGGQPQICHCELNGDRRDLLCSNQNLNTTDFDLEFEPSVVHMEHNSIQYLLKGKILPGREAAVLSLDFSSNLISDIEPGTFDKFDNLKVVKLTHNKIDSEQISTDWLTPKLGRNLHHLFLDFNFITTLDNDIFDNLNQLKKLVLDGNRGIKLSKGIFTKALGSLEVLSLDKCDIKELDGKIFENLTSLRALSLSGNPLDRIPAAVSVLRSLTHLGMSSTNLKELKEGDLQQTVPGLERLYMRKMKYLWKIGTNAFDGLTKLEYVDFSLCAKLRLLQPNAFGLDPPSNFTELILQKCNLSTLDANFLSKNSWKSLDVVKLNGNPFLCDCNLKWLLDMQKAVRTYHKTDEMTCKYPSDLAGLSLYDANKLHDLCDPTPSPSAKFVVFLVSMILFASLVTVGLVYARRRYMAKFGGEVRLPHFVNGTDFPRSHQMGFSSNGINIFDDDEEEGEAEEEQPREGVERPEFV